MCHTSLHVTFLKLIINLLLKPITIILRLTYTENSNLKVSDPLAEPHESHPLNTFLCCLVYIPDSPFILERKLYRRLVELPQRLDTHLSQVPVSFKSLLGRGKEV